jgi:hypothetical protein
MKKKTDMINHIPNKQVWLKENVILIKRCTNMGGSKNVKEPNEKKGFLSKDQSLKIGYSKKRNGWKNLTNYIKWKP